MTGCLAARGVGLLALAALAGFAWSGPVRAATCTEVGGARESTFQGQLARVVFPGPPNYEDVQRGDRPEPAYILTLDRSVCVQAEGGSELNRVPVDRIHLRLDQEISTSRNAYAALGRYTGTRVAVTGRDGFGAHTAHHRAPLVLTIVGIVPDQSPAETVTGGRSTVERFYRALGRGDGAAASGLVVPSKRQSGALSAPEISRFYGALAEPLRLVEIVAAGPDSYRVSYRYRAAKAPCEGAALVRTTTIDGTVLIESIRSLSGC